MSEHTVRSVLRIIAVTTVLIGVVLFLQAAAGLLAMKSFANNPAVNVQIPGGGRAGVFLFLGPFGVSAAGLVLWLVSDLLAAQVVGRDGSV